MKTITTTSANNRADSHRIALQSHPAETFFLAVRQLDHPLISPSEMKVNLKTSERSSREQQDATRSEQLEAPVRKQGHFMNSPVMNKSLKTAEQSQGELMNQQPKQSSKSAVRKPVQLWIGSSEMKTNFKAAEQESGERLDLQPTHQTISTDLTARSSHLGRGTVPPVAGVTDQHNQVQPTGCLTGKRREDILMDTQNNNSQTTTAATPKQGRYGIEVNTLAEEKDSTEQVRKFRFRLKVKGFMFWGAVEKSNGVLKVTWPWPKMVRVERNDEREDFERQTLEKLDAAVSAFDTAMA